MAIQGIEKHYSIQEVAELWGISQRTATRLFENEPDVLRICMKRRLGSTSDRTRVTLRIPESALHRVHQSWTQGIAAAKERRGCAPKVIEGAA